jgi:pyruvate dehydrogenase E2 component (dihydrolipoamide acetyltransferase)
LAKDVIMPALGMAQETGILLQWLKAEGEEVTQGEPLMEIETDKATVEVEAPASGTLVNVTAGPGDEVPVGQVIARILAPDDAPVPTSESALPLPVKVASQTSAASPRLDGRVETLVSPVAARIAAENKVDLRQIEAAGGRIQKEDVLAYLADQRESVIPLGGRVLASPKARRLAREQDLELAAITGSGPQGAILAADVLAVAVERSAIPAVPPPTPPPFAEPQPVPISRIWQIMVQRLTESWNTVPHFYLTAEANANRLSAWRESAQQRTTEKITYTDLLVKLVAAALRKHPRLNARWADGAILANDQINIGLAVAVEEGLLVPVIHEADRLGLGDLAARRKDLVTRAQAGKLSLDDLSNGTFTVSNLGMYGVDAFNAIVNPPQAAILALGRIADRVVPVDGRPAVQPMMTMTLSCDHRVVDGARGAQFLQTLVSFIEDPLGVLD